MIVLTLFLMIGQCVGMSGEAEPAVVVYCASGGPADASCQDLRRLEQAEYDAMVENDMNKVLVEFGKAATKAQQLYQSVIDWTSDTPQLVTDISCASGDCPPLPSVTKVDQSRTFLVFEQARSNRRTQTYTSNTFLVFEQARSNRWTQTYTSNTGTIHDGIALRIGKDGRVHVYSIWRYRTTLSNECPYSFGWSNGRRNFQ